MNASNSDWIDDLINAQRRGYSLDQAFYLHPAIFQRDVSRVFTRHWMMAGHTSQIPREGDYLLFEVAGESIILIRGPQQEVFAHYNVCRHRGSRVLLEPEGHARSLVCRYHGWSYATNGCLRIARHMPDGFEPAQHGLKPCHVTVLEGLILISLASGTPPDLSEVSKALAPFLQLQGIAAARVAERQNYQVRANWKLAIENYLECYHCKPAHPQYSQVEIKAEKAGDGSPAALKRYEARYQDWHAVAERHGTLIPEVNTTLPLDSRLPQTQFCAAYRAPLRQGYLSATEDGQPAAPLMGEFTEYDGGETALGLGPFTYMLASNDHAVFFQFIPIDAQSSEMIVNWLVREDAREHKDYDTERLSWLWSVTTKQDKTIIEANAAGIRSRQYQPGPASVLENDVVGFRNWYLAVIGGEDRISHLIGSGRGRYFGI